MSDKVAEGWRICRQAGNISAILKRTGNADKGQGKERYISNIGIGQKSIPYKFRISIHNLEIRYLPSIAG